MGNYASRIKYFLIIILKFILHIVVLGTWAAHQLNMFENNKTVFVEIFLFN